jgi:hypothetical protein
VFTSSFWWYSLWSNALSFALKTVAQELLNSNKDFTSIKDYVEAYNEISDKITGVSSI